LGWARGRGRKQSEGPMITYYSNNNCIYKKILFTIKIYFEGNLCYFAGSKARGLKAGELLRDSVY
jgi:hypothetical protein